jgi:hypothetical protein
VMDEWLVLQSFYNGLTTTSRAHLDAAARGAYLDLTIAKATALIEKMVSIQGWNEAFPAQNQGRNAYRQGDGHARRQAGPPTKED